MGRPSWVLSPIQHSGAGRRTKSVALPARRVSLNVDVYNVLNASTNIRYNSNFGSLWRVPNLICRRPSPEVQRRDF